MLNPRLTDLLTAIESSNQAAFEGTSAPPQLGSTEANHTALTEIGAELISGLRRTPVQALFYLLYLGNIFNWLYWVEFRSYPSGEVSLYIHKTEISLDVLGDRTPSISVILDSGTKYEQHQDQQYSTYFLANESIKAIKDCVRTCRDFFEAELGREQLRSKAQSKILSRLAYVGYDTKWPEELAFDLEKITKTGPCGEKAYYVDNLDELVIKNGMISFVDLTGRSISISAGSTYEIQSLTFTCVQDLQKESHTLVAKHVELIKGLIPHEDGLVFAEDLPEVDPIQLESLYPYEFIVPIPRIAQLLRPIIEIGGLNL